MSLLQPERRGRSPGLTTDLASNNPFRRAASPRTTVPNNTTTSPPPDVKRAMSRNPFLDNTGTAYTEASDAPPNMAQRMGGTEAQSKPALTGNAAELFENLTLDEQKNSTMSNNRRPVPRANTIDKPLPSVSRPENMRMRGPGQHRPSRSQEAELRSREPPPSGSRPRVPPNELDIFADPTSPKKTDNRRPRRNSETSVSERNGRVVDSEEERRRQERRRRDRRHRENGSKDEGSKIKKPSRKLDVIDKLDVTSIYGTGLFHHDGPFDACNPHRNRKGSQRAPMQAFPADSLNNALGGGGPLNRKPDHKTFLGKHDDEAFEDYATNKGSGGGGGSGLASSSAFDAYDNGAAMRPGGGVRRAEPSIMNAAARTEPVHGDETLGLGTSTFLEGAPASRTAMQRRDTDSDQQQQADGGVNGVGGGGGLSRKKSLAQKIRGISSNRRNPGEFNGSGSSSMTPGGRVTSPEGYGHAVVSTPPESGYTPGGGRTRASESNPFFNEYSQKNGEGSGEKKMASESISVVRPDRVGGGTRARAPSSPRRGFGDRLERRITGDGGSGSGSGSGSGEQGAAGGSSGSAGRERSASTSGGGGGGGFLSRVKSLKGGPRKGRDNGANKGMI